MLFKFSLSHIVFPLLAFSNVADAAIKDPTFTKIYDGVLLLDATSLGVLPGGTFGGRVLFPFLGGNFTDASTGELVANVIPGVGGELGVITGDSTIFTDVRLITQWVDDQTFGFWDVHGVGGVDLEWCTELGASGNQFRIPCGVDDILSFVGHRCHGEPSQVGDLRAGRLKEFMARRV